MIPHIYPTIYSTNENFEYSYPLILTRNVVLFQHFLCLSYSYVWTFPCVGSVLSNENQVDVYVCCRGRVVTNVGKTCGSTPCLILTINMFKLMKIKCLAVWENESFRNTRGVQYVMKTAQYIPKFYIYTHHNYFH